jgi:hypothetical protein
MAQFSLDESLLREALSAKMDEAPYLSVSIYPIGGFTVAELSRAIEGAVAVPQSSSSSASFNDYNWNDGGGALHKRLSTTNTCLEAKIMYGDNVLDIWASLAALFDLTGKVKNCAATIRDSMDGEILLVEAAEVIPDWMEPGNTTNRVWVRGGGIDILRKGDLSEPLSLDAAVGELGAGEAAAPRKVLEVLKAKVAEVSRTRNDQRSLLRLPRDVAGLIARDPGIVNKSIECFCAGLGEERSEGKGKWKGKSKKSKSMNRGPPVEVLVRFTRCLFAKLSFQRIPGQEELEVGEKLAAAIEFWAEENGVDIEDCEGRDFGVGQKEKGEVDGLGWMNLGGVEEFDELMKGTVSGGFDEVAEKMKGFVSGVSDYSGVEKEGDDKVEDKLEDEDVDIDPEKFLRILEGAVGGSGDKYFGNDGECEGEDEEDEGVGLEKPERTEIDDEVDAMKGDDASVDIDVDVVSNLIESVLGQEGSTGPAGNVLQQLGIKLDKLDV